MTYVPGSALGVEPPSGRGHGVPTAVDGRVAGAIVASQTFLVVRILSVLVGVSLLPARLPSVDLRLDATHAFVLPLAGINPGMALIAVAAISALELYLVYRLADRIRLARLGILVIESCAIVITTIALAFGAGFAILPLAASVGATCLLLLNRVRWAFLLQPRTRHLTGRRQGGTFAGYAAPSLESPKGPQQVGYLARRIEPSIAEPAAPPAVPAAGWSERASARPYTQPAAETPVADWADFGDYRVAEAPPGIPSPEPWGAGRPAV